MAERGTILPTEDPPAGTCPEADCGETRFTQVMTPDGQWTDPAGETWWQCDACGRRWPRSAIAMDAG